MMKKLRTEKLVASLEKAGRTTKKAIWTDLAERMCKKRRINTVVNLDEIDVMAKKFKGKTLVVPGKVLARGQLTEKVTVSAASVSAEAKEKIEAVGKFVPLAELAENASKVKTNELIILG